MGIVKNNIYHFENGATGSTNITSALDINETDGINTSAGTYTLTFNNKDNVYADKLRYGDKVKIEMGYEGSALSTVILGKIEDEEYQFSTARNAKIIKGYGPNRELQNYLVNQVVQSGTGITYTVSPYVFGYDQINSRNVVKLIIAEHVNGNSDGTVTMDYDTYVDTGSLCKPWANTLGSDFLKVWVNTNPGRVIDEIRTNTFTGAGDYDLYIDESNKVHFEPKGITTSDITLQEGVNILGHTTKRNIKPKFTAVMLFCGRDENGHGIYAAGYNTEGIAQYGFKWGYMNRGELWHNTSGLLVGESLATILDTTKEAGRIIARSMAEAEGLPKWTSTITLKGTTAFTLGSGQKVNIVLPSVSERFNPGELNLTDVKQTLNTRGWTTTLELEESTGEIF